MQRPRLPPPPPRQPHGCHSCCLQDAARNRGMHCVADARIRSLALNSWRRNNRPTPCTCAAASTVHLKPYAHPWVVLRVPHAAGSLFVDPAHPVGALGSRPRGNPSRGGGCGGTGGGNSGGPFCFLKLPFTCFNGGDALTWFLGSLAPATCSSALFLKPCCPRDGLQSQSQHCNRICAKSRTRSVVSCHPQPGFNSFPPSH